MEAAVPHIKWNSKINIIFMFSIPGTSEQEK